MPHGQQPLGRQPSGASGGLQSRGSRYSPTPIDSRRRSGPRLGQETRGGNDPSTTQLDPIFYESPDYLAGSFPNPGDASAFTQGLPEESRATTLGTVEGFFNANEQQRGQAAGASGGLRDLGSGFQDIYEDNQANEVASIQRALAGFQGSAAGQQLGQYSDPSYRAITDETVAARGRDIAKMQADAAAGGVAQASRQGIEGGSLAPNLGVASGFRGAYDTAKLRSDADIANESFRRSALSEMNQRDALAANIGLAESRAYGRPNPYAGFQSGLESQAASLDANSPIFAFDFTQLPRGDELKGAIANAGITEEVGVDMLNREVSRLEREITRTDDAEERARIQGDIDWFTNAISTLASAATALLR